MTSFCRWKGNSVFLSWLHLQCGILRYGKLLFALALLSNTPWRVRVFEVTSACARPGVWLVGEPYITEDYITHSPTRCDANCRCALVFCSKFIINILKLSRVQIAPNSTPHFPGSRAIRPSSAKGDSTNGCRDNRQNGRHTDGRHTEPPAFIVRFEHEEDAHLSAKMFMLSKK